MKTNQKLTIDEAAELLEKRLGSLAEKLVKQALDMGLYKSYRDNHCNSPEEFVHEYKDGRKELIRINCQSGCKEINRIL